MKRKLFFLVVFLFLGIMTKAQQHFYYYKGEKIYLELDLKRVSMNTNQREMVYEKKDELSFFQSRDYYLANKL